MKKILTLSFYIIAAFYTFIMMDLLFRFNILFNAGRVIMRSYNLIPFRTILEFIGEPDSVIDPFAVRNLLGNIVLFIPCGIYVRAMQKRGGFGKNLLTLILIFVAVELVQFAFGVGVGDIDDVILNALGGILGVAGYAFLEKALGKEAHARTVVAVTSLVVGIPVICVYFAAVFRF